MEGKMPSCHSSAELLQKANHCVACGLCLPHCPTYQKTRHEAQSPRGRIALIQGALAGQLPFNERFAQHIQACLLCRSCEEVCPSKVAFTDLMDGLRSILLLKRRHTVRQKFLEKLGFVLIARPYALRIVAEIMRLYQVSGAWHFLRQGRLLHWLGLDRAGDYLPPLGKTKQWAAVYPAMGVAKGQVALFLGCVARYLDTVTLDSTLYLLNRSGYNVHVPPRQTCCGALHLHHGLRREFERLALRNIQAFAIPHLDAIISTSSGCTAVLGEYPQTLSCTTQGFSGKVMGISAFLSQTGCETLPFKPLDSTIVVHAPCTLSNVVHGSGHVYSLLKHIPAARIMSLPGNPQCCGAAGSYFLTHPQMAQVLLDDKIAALKGCNARYLVTSNSGCAIHLAYGLRQAGLDLECSHPVTLLARQAGFSG
jgi:glycolate oxidase iron-sulfur subunit